MAAFTQNLLWLSTRIISEEDCDCLRFIASSVLEKNQQHKNPKEVLEQLEDANLLSENNIHIVYEALTLMNQNKLRSEFLEKIGSQQYKPKPSVISTFTRMLISVRHTLGRNELSNIVFYYKKGKGAGIIEYQNRAYAVLLYLLDKLLLTNDVESLNKFADILEVARSIRGQNFVKKYLKENPDLPERAGSSESNQDNLSTGTDDCTQEDSNKISNAGTYSIKGNQNVIVITPQNLSIGTKATGVQDHIEHTLPGDSDSTDLGYSSPLLSPGMRAPNEQMSGGDDETDAPAGADREAVLEAHTVIDGAERKWPLMYWLIACGIVVISITAFTLPNIYPDIKVPLMYWLIACGIVVILVIVFILLNVYSTSNSFSKEKEVICVIFICLIILFFIGVIYNVVYFKSLSGTQKSSIFACFVIIIIILTALYDFNATLTQLELLSDIKKVAVSCIITIFLLMFFHVISNIERILKPLFDILFMLWR